MKRKASEVELENEQGLKKMKNNEEEENFSSLPVDIFNLIVKDLPLPEIMLLQEVSGIIIFYYF